MSQQQLNLPMIEVAGYCFNAASLIAIDTTGYEEGRDGRQIMLSLVGPHGHTFWNERADKAWVWYLGLTGQARITT